MGTMDANANTTMFLHLPHKIPHNIPEVELSSHIQVDAVCFCSKAAGCSHSHLINKTCLNLIFCAGSKFDGSWVAVQMHITQNDDIAHA